MSGRAPGVEYDAAGRLVWVSDESNPYDGAGEGTKPSVEYTYTADGQIQTETRWVDISAGVSTTTRYSYDPSGRLESVTTADGTPDASTVSYDYGPLGRLESVTVGAAPSPDQVTRYCYDTDGNQVARVEGAAAGVDCSDLGNLPSGALVWASGFDFLGRVVCEADPLDTKVFLADGNLDCDAPGATFSARYEYDPAGRLTAVERAPGEDVDLDPSAADTMTRTEYVYDQAGRLYQTLAETGRAGVTDPADPLFGRFGVVEERVYHPSGRLAEVRVPPPDVWAFDWVGGSGKVVTRYEYDLAGRLASVTEAYGTTEAATTVYSYDPHGWLLAETSPAGRQSTYVYDPLGRQVRVSRPHESSGTATQARGYSPTGLLSFETDFYLTPPDPADPPPAGTPTRAFSYNDAGWLTSATDAVGTVVGYCYDLRGNRIERRSTRAQGSAPVLDCAQPVGSADVAESWVYDDADRMISHTFPRDDTASTTVTYSYDGLGRLSQVVEPLAADQSRCATTVYDGHRVDKLTYALYNPNTESCAVPQSSVEVLFGYDPLDRRVSVTDTRGGVAAQTRYSFDQAGRLYERVDGHQGEATGWRYAIGGELIRLEHPDGALLRFGHDLRRRLTDTSVAFFGSWVPIAGYSYDADGLETLEVLNNSTAKFREYLRYGSGQLERFRQDMAKANLNLPGFRRGSGYWVAAGSAAVV